MGYPYTRITDPQSSDLVMMWDNSRSGYSLCAWSDLYTLIENNLNLSEAGVQEPYSQYAAPSVTGFDIDINTGLTDQSVDTHLILTPTNALADGAITLPVPGSLRDKQIVIVNCTQQITAFTVNGNGASAVKGAPTSLGADDYFTLKYDITVDSWYRIG